MDLPVRRVDVHDVPVPGRGHRLVLHVDVDDDRLPRPDRLRERRAFMKECLSAGKPAAADNKSAQQEKMKMCNEKATGKTGDERRAFMKECLKG